MGKKISNVNKPIISNIFLQLTRICCLNRCLVHKFRPKLDLEVLEKNLVFYVIVFRHYLKY